MAAKYISFSGGLDSTILSFLVCQTYREYRLEGTIHLVFSDTGTEFPEVREFACRYAEWLKARFPERDITFEFILPKEGWNFKRACEEKGFPILSKDTADKIHKLWHGKLGERYRSRERDRMYLWLSDGKRAVPDTEIIPISRPGLQINL